MIELNINLEGSLSPETCFDFYRDQSCPLPCKDEKEMKGLLSITKPFSDEVTIENSLYKMTLPVLQQNQAIERAAYELITKLAKQGTSYAEIALAPIRFTHQTLSQLAVVEAVISGVSRARMDLKGQIQVNLVLGLVRGEKESNNLETVEVANRLKGTIVNGLILEGEENTPVNKYQKVLNQAYKLNIPFSVATNKLQDTKDAITLGAKRIIGGLACTEDEEVIKMIKDKNVLIVTSLLQLFYTGKLKRLIDHPLPLMKKNGLKVVLSSSDPALFDSNINREYTLARDLFFISYKDCMDMEKLAFEEKLMK